MRIHYFQHVPFEGLGSIEEWARLQGHSLSATRFFAGDALPSVEEIDWLVVMGGSMNVYETGKHSWLTKEKRFIEQAVKSDKIVLGICLGAQLIADVLGARVFRNQAKEIGWFPVEFTEQAEQSKLFDFFPKQMSVLHWHGDTFDLPSGAVHIARSEACQNQAFEYARKIVGLQFHLEMTEQSTKQIVENCIDELVAETYIQTPNQILTTNANFQETNRAMHALLDRLDGFAKE